MAKSKRELIIDLRNQGVVPGVLDVPQVEKVKSETRRKTVNSRKESFDQERDKQMSELSHFIKSATLENLRKKKKDLESEKDSISKKGPKEKAQKRMLETMLQEINRAIKNFKVNEVVVPMPAEQGITEQDKNVQIANSNTGDSSEVVLEKDAVIKEEQIAAEASDDGAKKELVEDENVKEKEEVDKAFSNHKNNPQKIKEVLEFIKGYYGNPELDAYINQRLSEEMIAIDTVQDEGMEKAAENTENSSSENNEALLSGSVIPDSDNEVLPVAIMNDLEKLQAESEKVVDSLTTHQKKSFFEGLANVGFRTTEIKSSVLKKVLKKISQDCGDGTFGKFFNEYAKIHEKEENNAIKMQNMEGKNFLSKASGVGQGVGNTFGKMFKFFRIGYDIASENPINPLRYWTMGLVLAGESAEALKEVRMKSEEAQNNTVIGKLDAAGNVAEEDFERAWEEAWEIYNEAKKKGNGQVTFENLNIAYHEKLPEDLAQRLKRVDNAGIGLMQKILNKDLGWYIQGLNKKIEIIEKNEKYSEIEKDKRKKELLLRNEALLNDLDRMIGDQGLIDQISYWTRIAEKTSKTGANLIILDTVYQLAHAGWECAKVSDWMQKIIDRFEGGNGQDIENISSQVPNLTQKIEVKIIGLPSKTKDWEDSIPKQVQPTPWMDVSVEKEGAERVVAGDQVKMTDRAELESQVIKNIVPADAIKSFEQSSIKIGGKIDTYSEAVQELVKQAPVNVQDNFIHNVLGKDVLIGDADRKAKLIQAIRKISSFNNQIGDGNDVSNLVYEGNQVVLNQNGQIQVLKGDSHFAAKIVSEESLRNIPPKTDLEKIETATETETNDTNSLEDSKDVPENYLSGRSWSSPIANATRIISERHDDQTWLHYFDSDNDNRADVLRISDNAGNALFEKKVDGGAASIKQATEEAYSFISERKKFLDNLENKGIFPRFLREKLGINPYGQNLFDNKQAMTMINFLEKHSDDSDDFTKAQDVACLVKDFSLEIDLNSAYHYFDELKKFSNDPSLIRGACGLLESVNIKESLESILSMPIKNENFKIKDGVFIVENYLHDGYNFVISKIGGKLVFGIDGPGGNNWNMRKMFSIAPKGVFDSDSFFEAKKWIKDNYIFHHDKN